MNQLYISRHWFFTLIIGAVLAQLISLILIPGEENNIIQFEILPFLLIYGIIFSLPTLGVYLITFYILRSQKVSIKLAKTILIVVSICGIIISFILLTQPNIDYSLIIGYSTSSILTGSFFDLEKKV